MNLTDLKHLARTLFLEGVRAADPKSAVQRALTAEPLKVNPEGRLLVIAFGKASVAMIQQALQHIPAAQRIEAIAVTNYENAREIDGCRVMAAGHPLPDQNGIEQTHHHHHANPSPEEVLPLQWPPVGASPDSVAAN